MKSRKKTFKNCDQRLKTQNLKLVQGSKSGQLVSASDRDLVF